MVWSGRDTACHAPTDEGVAAAVVVGGDGDDGGGGGEDNQE